MKLSDYYAYEEWHMRELMDTRRRKVDWAMVVFTVAATIFFISSLAWAIYGR